MEIKTYNLFCKTCKKKTEHSIYHQSRKRGVKLFCLICNTKKPRYYNLRNLEDKNANL